MVDNNRIRRRITQAALLCILMIYINIIIPNKAVSQVGVSAKEIDPMVTKAIAFLKSKQEADGSILPKAGGPGVTALAVAALIRLNRADDPLVTKGLAYLEKNIQADGGIYNKRLANYSTCVALVAFKEANKNGKYDQVIANAVKFVKSLQNSDESSSMFGGVGYDGKERPDLSNTQFFVETLIQAGVDKNDPAITRALGFISKCQNLPSEANKLEFAKKASADDKGGFVYNPAEANNPKSPNLTAEGGLRSAGVMGYAGLKSFLYAGVGKEDPRVKAAIAWIRAHYSLEENPGQKDAGLYYYYHTFAKAMEVLNEEDFVDAKGNKHPWRKELFETLKKKQNENGSWVNSNRMFFENAPELATTFALLALSYCEKK